jgi:hypothetical protein
MENAKKLVRKASRLQQHQIMKILQPSLEARLQNICIIFLFLKIFILKALVVVLP